jgi:hypothetical protein
MAGVHKPGPAPGTGGHLVAWRDDRKCHWDTARGGWYYDVDPAQGRPTLIRACEASRRQFKPMPMRRVDLVFGCTTHVVE